MLGKFRTAVLHGAMLVAVIVGMPQAAAAGNIKDIVANLYGGDGITLDPNVSGFHSPHFSTDSASALNDLSNAITSGAGLFALNSAVTGFTFDLEAGIPVRTSESLGPLLSERASTIGKDKLNVAFTYTRVDFKRFEGDDLDSLSLSLRHDDCCPVDGTLGAPGAAFELDTVDVNIDLELEQNIFAFFATYGITELWDAGIVVPVIYIDAKASATATVNGDLSIHAFGGAAPDSPTDRIEEDALGVGDIILRTKYDLSDLVAQGSQSSVPDLGVLGQVSLETGDEDDLLGAGESTFLGMIIASKKFDWFTPHANLGYELATGNTDNLNNLRYVVGFDAKLDSQLSAAIDVLGRWHPNGDGKRDTVDIAIGAKWDPFERVPIQANFLIPINRDTGLRADVIWSVGFEITF